LISIYIYIYNGSKRNNSEVNRMPNKMIYISEADLPTFQRAQALAGGALSAVIARALRLFVETEEAKAQQIDEVTVVVGNDGDYQRQRFKGRILAKQGIQSDDDLMLSRIVYRTARGKLAVYTKEIPHWSMWHQTDWATWNLTGEYRLEVYEQLEELKPHLPPDLYETVEQALSKILNQAELLDI